MKKGSNDYRPSGFKGRLKSFGYAFRGIRTFFSEEPNARVHFICSLVAIAMGWILSLSNWEWVIIIFCIAIVIVAELVNSSLERICNLVHPGHHPLVKKAKDMAAGAVLMAAIAACIIACIIFLPKLVILLS